MLRFCWICIIVACLWLSGCGGPQVNVDNDSLMLANPPTPTSASEAFIAKSTSTGVSLPILQDTVIAKSKEDFVLPAATPVFTGSLQVERASLDKPPELPADLLYLNGGKLMRWDRQSAMAVSFSDQFIPGNIASRIGGYGSRAQVIEYSTDATQRWIALLVAKGIAANGIDLHDIYMLDLGTGDQMKLSENSRRAKNLSLSPDGRWLTYQIEDNGINLYVMENLPGVEPVYLAECLPGDMGECESAVWSPDSQKLLWIDRNGVWFYENGRKGVVNILGNKLKVQDARGDMQELPVEYRGLVWSSEGRYATVTIQSKTFERTWVGLLDIRLKHVVEVPDTYKVENPSSRTAWLKDGRLLTAFGEDARGTPAHIKIWTLLPAHESILVLDDIVNMSSLSAADEKSRLPAEGILSIDNVTAHNLREFCMVIRFDDGGKPPTLYCLDLKFRLLQKIGEIPHDLVGLAFSPDNKSVIMTGSHGSTLYVSRDQEIHLDINPLLGDHPTRITWLNRNVAGKPKQ